MSIHRRPPRRRTFDPEILKHLRLMPAERTLSLLSVYFKSDPTYFPLKETTSRRWHVSTARGEFEILTTGVKWYDTREKKGGGGAIDLVMHIHDLSFVDAVMLLEKRVHSHG